MADTISDLREDDAIKLANSYITKSHALETSLKSMTKELKANPALGLDAIFNTALTELKGSLEAVKSFTAKWEDKGAIDRYTNSARPSDGNFPNFVSDITSNKGNIQNNLDAAIAASNTASNALKSTTGGSATTVVPNAIQSLAIPGTAAEKTEHEAELQAQEAINYTKGEIATAPIVPSVAASSPLPTSNADPDADKFAAQAASKAKDIVGGGPAAAPAPQYSAQELAYFTEVAAKEEALKAHGLNGADIKESMDKDNAAMIEWAKANPAPVDQGDQNAHIPSIGTPAVAAAIPTANETIGGVATAGLDQSTQAMLRAGAAQNSLESAAYRAGERATSGPAVIDQGDTLAHVPSSAPAAVAAPAPQYSAQELAFFAQIQSQIDSGQTTDQINAGVASLAGNGSGGGMGADSSMPGAQPPAPTFAEYDESKTYNMGGGARFR